MSIEDLVRSVISKKDPAGFYVIVADRNALPIVEKYAKDVQVEEYGDSLVIRTKSRRVAEELARRLARKNMLRFEL